MNSELLERAKKYLEEGRASYDVRRSLVGQGFKESDVVEALSELQVVDSPVFDKRNIGIFSFKEVFDRVGYGFSSIQFINILFYFSGAGFFLVGLVNGLKTILSILLSSFIQEYAKVNRVKHSFLSTTGVLFGLSFLFIGLAVAIKNLWLFAIALLIGSIGVVTYGDLYERISQEYLRKEKLSKFLLKISHFGVLITALGLVLSGMLFDRFPIIGAQKVNVFGSLVALPGYLISFEITALAFILSGYILHFIKERKREKDAAGAAGFFSTYWERIMNQVSSLFKDKHLVLLLVASSVIGLVQILGNSFYGIFIYNKFETGQFAGIFTGTFTNIAIIFVFAIIVSFIGPSFAAFLNRKVGLAPAMVFGSLLIAMMPLVCAYNARYLSVSTANALSVLGAAILGMGQGLLVRKLLREDQRSAYYAALGVGTVIPFLILIPAGAWIAQSMGLITLFKVLAFTTLGVAAPIFFILVLLANKQRL